MAAFDPEVELTHPADYRLMANTFVTLFWRPEVLHYGHSLNALNDCLGDVAVRDYDRVDDDARTLLPGSAAPDGR